MTESRAIGEPRLVGRDSERQELDRLFADVLAGRGRAVVLRGEAGIGKSALLAHLSERASGLRVARAVGFESETQLAYSGIHQLCRPMLEHLDQLPAPQQDALATVLGRRNGAAPDRFMVGLATLTLLAVIADEKPLVCIVDDAQWLDRASAQILAFVARRLFAERIALVCAARTGPGDDVLSGLPELRVNGLADGDARTLLLESVHGLLDSTIREQIVAECHGNPLALLELPRTWGAANLAGGLGLPDNRSIGGKVEQSYALRVAELPRDGQLLVLVAAADPTGDPLLLDRAAKTLGLDMAALDPAVEAGLLKVGRRVVFAHPLVRSAAYRSAKADERRRAHSSLAEATDPETAPDRRAWHRAGAAVGVDDDVAAELERSASRAQSRGGVAAAAAFLERSAALTADPAQRVERALAAANASLLAGALDAALALVAIAETGTPDALQRARAELLRAQIAFATDRGGSAPALLIRAVKQIEPLDARLARASYFEALSAAELAARLAGPGGSPRDVASAVKTAPPAPSPPRAADLLLDGWATLFENGEVAAMPTLQEALNRFDDRMPAAAQIQLFWLATITAAQVWDDARWEDLAERHVDLVRGTGLLTELPLALSSLAVLNLFKGRVSTAARQIDETAVAIEATAAAVSPWGALVLAAFRGREHDALPLLKGAATDATRRGEGVGLTMIAWGRAVLHNGLREYDKALAAGIEAAECPTNSGAAAWSIAEVVEAAVRRDRREIAREYGERLAEIADAAGTDWSLGVSARTRALLSANTTAEELYREALERLERCDMRVDLARSHLLYGEWLRRRKRRADARVQLRAAHDLFTSMGLEAFAERARNELSATGERVRKRTDETRDDLTAQERQIAQLAADGLSNPEIGTRLFLSPKTIEWHLGKVFLKLGIKSRANLRDVLPSAELG